jgi:hypothetical protein
MPDQIPDDLGRPIGTVVIDHEDVHGFGQ